MLINHPSSDIYIYTADEGAGASPLGVRGRGITGCLLSVAPRAAWKGCYYVGEASTSPSTLPRPSSLLPDQSKDPTSGPGRAGKRPAGPGLRRLRRRWRGGGAEEQLHLLCLPIALQAEPPEFPFARRSIVPTLRTEADHHSHGLPGPGGIEAPGLSIPGMRRLAPVPPPRPRAPHSPPGRAPQD